MRKGYTVMVVIEAQRSLNDRSSDLNGIYLIHRLPFGKEDKLVWMKSSRVKVWMVLGCMRTMGTCS